MKKVLIITSRSYPSIGGVEKVVDQLAVGLVNRGFHVRVLTNFFRTKKGGLQSMGDFFSQPFLDHVKALIGLGYTYNGYSVTETYFIFPGISRLRTIMAFFIFPFTLIHFLFQLILFKPDVLNLHFADNVTVYGLIYKAFFKKGILISSLHGNDIGVFPRRSSLQLFLLKKLITFSDSVVFVSESLRKEAENTLGMKIESSSIIYNSTPTPISVDVRRNPNLLLFVGRIVKKKGVDILVDAFNHLQAKYRELELWVVGDGDELLNISNSNRNRRIKFWGFATDPIQMAKFYKSSTIFIAPSRYEPFGKVAIEAMSYGCVVVASNVGGLNEVVKDGENGLLFETEEINSLVGILEKVLNDKGLQKTLVQNAYKDLEKRFTEKVFIDKYELVINNAAK